MSTWSHWSVSSGLPEDTGEPLEMETSTRWEEWKVDEGVLSNTGTHPPTGKYEETPNGEWFLIAHEKKGRR